MYRKVDLLWLVVMYSSNISGPFVMSFEGGRRSSRITYTSPERGSPLMCTFMYLYLFTLSIFSSSDCLFERWNYLKKN